MKFFSAKGLKGRPNIDNRADYDFMLEMWAEDLADVNEQIFIAACKSLSSQLTFFPAFAEVRKRCLDMSNGKIESAGEEWGKIKRNMMAACHAYANPGDFENAINGIKNKATKEAARLFDWKAFGLDDESNESFHKTHFEKLYNSIVERKAVEGENERLGLAAPGEVGGLLGNLVKKIV